MERKGGGRGGAKREEKERRERRERRKRREKREREYNARYIGVMETFTQISNGTIYK